MFDHKDKFNPFFFCHTDVRLKTEFYQLLFNRATLITKYSEANLGRNIITVEPLCEVKSLLKRVGFFTLRIICGKNNSYS